MILAPDASPPRPAFRGRRDGRSPEGRPKVESMKTPIKKALMQVGLEQPARSLYWFLRRASRTARCLDRRIAQRYLAQAQEPKLHIGCGSWLLDGWLNSDLYPGSAGILLLDARRRFPFPDDTFAYIYSEHMIEHLTFREGMAMLGECHRVLAPGGKVRVTAPDLAFLVDLYRGEGASGSSAGECENGSDEENGPVREGCSALQERFLKRYRRVRWREQVPGENGPPAWLAGERGYVINLFMRAYGHQFIHDWGVLRGMLEQSGFSNVVRCGLNDSDDAAFRNLANDGRMQAGFLALQSLTLEASKLRGDMQPSLPPEP